MSDVGQMVLLPRLLAFMKEEAPNASLRACPVPLEEPGGMLASGEVDLAVGYFTTLVGGFRQSVLFQESYSCVVRADHPDFAAGMSLEAFRVAPRAMADATGMSHAVMEHQLARHGIHGTPKLRVPQFMVLPLVIARSDLLVVMPSRLAETFASLVPLKVMTPPVSLPVFDIAVYWHERFNATPAIAGSGAPSSGCSGASPRLIQTWRGLLTPSRQASLTWPIGSGAPEFSGHK
jgi:DNA-binding transcriptional LysR family regulator